VSTPYIKAVPKIEAALKAAGALTVEVTRRDSRMDVEVKATYADEDTEDTFNDVVETACKDLGWDYLDLDGDILEPYAILRWDEPRVPASVHAETLAELTEARAEIGRLRADAVTAGQRVERAEDGEDEALADLERSATILGAAREDLRKARAEVVRLTRASADADELRAEIAALRGLAEGAVGSRPRTDASDADVGRLLRELWGADPDPSHGWHLHHWPDLELPYVAHASEDRPEFVGASPIDVLEQALAFARRPGRAGGEP
jgi:hypothetical protein